MLSNTAYTILAMLSNGPKTGYDIKNKVDQSTQFFWTASYGQIYPELRRLAEIGMISGAEKSQGKRTRTEYTINKAGHEALLEWLRRPAETCELRDDGLLKIFFAEELEPGEAIALVRSIEAERRDSLNQLHDIDRVLGDELDPFKRAVLDYGIGLFEHAIAWCQRLAVDIEQGIDNGARPSGQLPDRSPEPAVR